MQTSSYFLKNTTFAALAALLVALPMVIPAADEPAKTDPAEELYFGANAMYNRSLYELALKEYEKFLSQYPQHARAASAELGKGLCLYGLERYKDAEPLLAKGAARGDELAKQVGVLRGQCLLKMDQAAEAEKVFAAASGNTQGTVQTDAMVGLIEARAMQKKWLETIVASQQLLDAAPTNPNAARVRFHGAVARFHLGKFAEAAPLLEQVKAIPDQPALAHQAKFLLAECRRELGELDAAMALYQATAADKGGAFAAESQFRLGCVLLLQKKYPEAAAALKAYADANPTGAFAGWARLYLGQAYVESRSYPQAEAVLKPLATATPPDIEAAIWLARVYSRQTRMADAAATLDAALPQAGKSINVPGLLFDLGTARMALKEYPKAAEAFGRIAAESPTWTQAPEALYLKALAQHRAADYAGSLASCDAFVAAHKAHTRGPEVAFMRAENLLMLARDADALAAYTAFLAANPKHESAQVAVFRTAQIQHKLQKWDEALAAVLPLASANLTAAPFETLNFLIGDCYFSKEQWTDAATHLKLFAAAQKNHSQRDTALLKLALAYSRQNQGTAAIPVLTELTTAYANSAQRPLALVELGRLQYEAKQYAPARAALQAVAAIQEATPQARAQAEYYLGWVALAEKKMDEAGTHFDALVKQYADNPLVPDALLQSGLAQMEAKNYPAAEAAFTRLANDFPKYAKADHARHYLGLAQARQEKWQPAAQQFAAVLAQHAGSPVRDQALYESAWCAKRLNDTTAATGHYEQLLKEFPQSDLAQRATFELAELEFEAGQYEPAANRLATLLAAVRDNELKEHVLYRQGWCHAKRKDPAKAAASFEALLAAFPTSTFAATAAYQAGEAHMERKEYPAALALFERAEAAARQSDKAVHELALLRLGESRALTSQWQQSEQAYAALLQGYPASAWARRAQLGVGWARENLQQYPQAIEAYTKIASGSERDEPGARAQFQIGECLFALKRYEEAVQALIRVSVAYGYPEWSSKALLEAGRALEQMGKPELARGQYDDVVKSYPESDAATVAKTRLQALTKP